MEYTMSEMQSLIKTFVTVQRPLMMWGPPGIGKSDSARQVAKAIAAERGKTFTEGLLQIRYKGTELESADLQVERKDPKTHFFFIDVRLSQMDPSDLRGIPFPDKNTTRWLPPNWLPTLGEGILFFDEINLAAPSIQASCLPKGFYISGSARTIDELRAGNLVISVDGTPTRVVAPMKRHYRGKLYTVKPVGMMPIQFTSEHPVLVVDRITYASVKNPRNPKGWGRVAKFGDPHFVNASDLKKTQYVLIPKSKGYDDTRELDFRPFAKQYSVGNMSVPLNEEVAELLGLYLAEGSSGTYVDLAFHAKETHLHQFVKNTVEKYVGYKVRFKDLRPKYNALRVQFGGNILARAFKEWFGKNAREKVIPEFILNHKNPDIVKAFLQGYFKGDGCCYRDTIIMGTASRRLAEQLQFALARFGLYVNITFYKDPHRRFIRGREIFSHGAYTVKSRSPNLLAFFGFPSHAKRHMEWAKDIGDYVAVRIDKIESKQWEGEVFNCETESHTYTVGNVAVHNCFQLVLDRRLGDYCLPDGWTIVAAGNRLQDSANVFAMAKPLHNRFAHGELIPPPFDPDWREWALAHGVHIDVVAFVGSNLQWLYKNDPKSTDPAFPTHRSWALAGQVLSSKGLNPTTDEAINEMYKLVGACVGQGAASYFKGFLKVRKTIKIEDLLKNPEKVKTLKENEVLYALSSGLAGKYGADRKLMTPVLAVLGHMEADDMAVFTLRLMRGVQATNFSTDLTGSPLWPKLSGRFGKFLL